MKGAEDMLNREAINALVRSGAKYYRVTGVGEFQGIEGNVWAKSEEGAKKTIGRNVGFLDEIELAFFEATAEIVLIANTLEELEAERLKSPYYQKIAELIGSFD